MGELTVTARDRVRPLEADCSRLCSRWHITSRAPHTHGARPRARRASVPVHERTRVGRDPTAVGVAGRGCGPRGLSATGTWAGQPPSPSPGRTVLVKAAQIIDGRGGAPLRNGGVLIRGDRVERVGPAAGMTADSVIDLGAATVLPGLIDLHTHLTDEVGTNWESALLSTTPDAPPSTARSTRGPRCWRASRRRATWGPPGPTWTSTCATPSTRARCPGRGCRWPATTCRPRAARATRASSPSTSTCRSCATWPTASTRCAGSCARTSRTAPTSSRCWRRAP